MRIIKLSDFKNLFSKTKLSGIESLFSSSLSCPIEYFFMKLFEDNCEFYRNRNEKTRFETLYIREEWIGHVCWKHEWMIPNRKRYERLLCEFTIEKYTTISMDDLQKLEKLVEEKYPEIK